MQRARLAACLIACSWPGFAAAQTELYVVGGLDLRWVHAQSQSSYLYGGLGTLRFDPDHEGIRLGRAFLAPRLRFTDILTLHAVVDAYGDHDRNTFDLSELWAELRPFPTNAIRWQVKVGAFHMPVSLENRGAGWSDVYAITPSALNSWLGEEFRTIGTEVEGRWLGASSGYVGDVSLVAAVYAWNDPAGSLISDGGFSLTDRPSTIFGGLGKPPITFYHEVDRKPGFYGGITWRHHERLEMRALHYDNRGNTDAATAVAGSAWRTRFSSFGARLEPDARWTLIGQYLDGDTADGANSELGYDRLRMTYHAAFALTSYQWGRARFTARFDDFGTHQWSGFVGPPSDETGHAWSAAWSYDCGDHWQLIAEWIRVWSRFQPRLIYGQPPGYLESQTQIAARYRFHFGG